MASNNITGSHNYTSSCLACEDPDWVDDMVQCEECGGWYHFRCVGVTRSVENRYWACDDCLPISVHSQSSKASISKSLAQQRLEEEQQIHRKRFLKEIALEKEQIELEKRLIVEEEEMEMTFLLEKFALLAEQEGDEERSVASNRSRSRASQEKIIDWMRNNGSKEPKASTPNDAVEKAPNPEISLPPVPSSRRRPSQTLAPTPALAQQVLPHSRPEPLPRSSLRVPKTRTRPAAQAPPPAPPASAASDDGTIDVPPAPFQYAPSEVHGDHSSRLPRSGARVKRVRLPGMVNQTPVPIPMQLPPPRNVRHANPPVNPVPNREEEIPGPSSMQIAARRVMSRDLPDFDGNPEDWPIFISQYNITTECCGYSDAENLVRLQRCLKGHARDSVRSRLLLPASVPQLMETLKMLYGRPGLLITALLNRVRSAPAPRMERLETIVEFGMELQGLCDHLLAAGEMAHLNNPSLLQELEDKLPSQLKLQWAMHKQTVTGVTLQTFATYMSQMVNAASQVTRLVNCPVDRRTGDQRKMGNQKEKVQVYTHCSINEESASGSSSHPASTGRNCAVCNEPDHRVKDCKEFLELNVEDRWRSIHSLKMCRTCLNQHGRNRCRLSTKCGIDGCEFKHHPLLHSQTENKPPATAENHSHRDLGSKTLFRVVPVKLTGKSGSVNTFAFLDDGSSLTLVEKSLAKQLGESGPTGALYLNWTSNVTRCEEDSQEICFQISGVSSEKSFQVKSARTVSELNLPIQSLNPKQLSLQYAHLKGLPIAEYQEAVPRVLIGLDQLNLSMPLKCREGCKGEPVATKTRLGWCVYGGGNNAKSVGVSCHISEVQSEKDLHEVVKRYFEQEDTGTKPLVKLESVEDMRAKKILDNTTIRVNGRFETGLIWRYDHFEFPESYHMALRRLECLERRMAREPALKENVLKQIEDYQAKGYAHRASEEELANVDPRKIWYLPLGIVTSPKKPGKVRLIWDAAAKVDGISLNMVLLKGPDLLTCLAGVLCHFREKPVGVSGDIREMFHQFFVRSADRPAQSFLMRTEPSQTPDVYFMDVATFGATCSPCSAHYIKNKNAEEFAIKYPRAAEAIIKFHYVDDYLDSFDTIEEAQQVAAEVRLIHGKGGFEIRGWRSNSQDVLNYLGETVAPVAKDLNLDKSDGVERVLGMLWFPIEDVLGFSTQMRKDISAIIDNGRRPTKRQVLRCVMTLFDPLGLLAVYTVHGKILIQSIWRSGSDWDEEIGEEAFNRWLKWIGILNQVDNIRIPRCYVGQTTSASLRSVELHVFVDASEEAYSAAVYFRFMLINGTIICNLVSAKTKVAPLKPLSIPRLELQAAVLGARLASFVQDNHTLSIEKRVFWSDSSTVLAWIRSDARRYRQYVACRIGEILTLSECNEWRWVPSKMNSADEATKWGHGPCLSSEGRWFQGPKFLYQSEQQWPHQSFKQNVCTEEELRSCFVHEVSTLEPIVNFVRFSRWKRLLRTIGL